MLTNELQEHIFKILSDLSDNYKTIYITTDNIIIFAYFILLQKANKIIEQKPDMLEHVKNKFKYFIKIQSSDISAIELNTHEDVKHLYSKEFDMIDDECIMNKAIIKLSRDFNLLLNIED